MELCVAWPRTLLLPALLISSLPACNKIECLHYQSVDIKSTVLESFESAPLVTTYLEVTPDGQSYPPQRDSIRFDLASGFQIEIEGVLLSAVNGSDLSRQNAHIRAYSSPVEICGIGQSDELTFRLDPVVVQGLIHADSVDEDFQSDVVLHVHLDDQPLIATCGFSGPLDLSVRLQTDAAQVSDRIAPTLHGCKDI